HSPSRMNSTKLNEYCLRQVFSSLKSNSHLLSVACTCKQWFDVASTDLRINQPTSLKIFQHERNLDRYREMILHDYQLAAADSRFNLARTTPDTTEDHVLIEGLVDVPLARICRALSTLFESVTNLVIDSFNIDHAQVLAGFPNLQTLTL